MSAHGTSPGSIRCPGHHRDATGHQFHGGHGEIPGRVTVLYERGFDVYAVELRRDGALVERVDEVFFDSLGGTLERLIDDGNWRRIRVQCLSGRKAVRH